MNGAVATASRWRIAALLNLPPRLSRRDVETALRASVLNGAAVSAPVADLLDDLDNGAVLTLDSLGWRALAQADAPAPPTPVLTLRRSVDDPSHVDATGTAADMLAHIGRTLYGERWIMPLSRALEISDDTISRWMSGRVILQADHGVFADAAALLARRTAQIAAASDALREWRTDA
jgi:hypothetical protein